MRGIAKAACIALWLAGSAATALAQGQPDALAKAFGARETISSASLSPDGRTIALIASGPGRTSRAYVLEAREGADIKVVASTSGRPEYLQRCDWVSADRLACQIYGDDVYGSSNVFSVSANGADTKLLSQRRGANALSYDFRGGDVIDLLPGDEDAVLMTRSYVPEATAGSLIEKKLEGLGVDRIDTRSGSAKRIESPDKLAVDYVSDGQGQVRIMALQENRTSGYAKGTYKFLYRPVGKSGWSNLSLYDTRDNSGFYPVAVDPTKNVAYGFEKMHGRDALVTVALDPGLAKTVIFSRLDVDVSGLIRVGRDRRVVGASYVTDHRQAVYFDEQAKALVSSLGKALGGKAINISDMSSDGNRVLIWAGSDVDPGQYYLFDRAKIVSGHA